MSALDLLLTGRARIEQGWCKGAFTKLNFADPRMEYCARGALGRTSLLAGDVVIEEAEAMLWAALPEFQELYASKGNCVAVWNNYVDTTRQDVLDLFDRAIAAATVEVEIEAVPELISA